MMKTEKENIVEKYLTKKYVAEDRDRVEILITKEGTLVGNIVSSIFRNLSSDQQQNHLEDTLKELKQVRNISGPIYPALLLYSPEEFYLMPAYEGNQIRGILKSLDINTVGANDLIVRISEDDWQQISAKADSLEGDTLIPFKGEIHRRENDHLFPTVDKIFQICEYKFFEAEGYQFYTITNAKFSNKPDSNIALIMFSAKRMPYND